MAMLSRGSALTTDRVIFVPESEGAHYYQIVSTDEELRFQRFTSTGKPPVDANQRFVGDRGDDANVDTFLVLSDPFTANVATLAGDPTVAQKTIRITKPIKALDDVTVRGALVVHDGVHFAGNAYIDANGRISGVPEVHVDGDLRADGVVRIEGGDLLVGNVLVKEDAANAALCISSNVHVDGDELMIGATHDTGLRVGEDGYVSLVAGNSQRIAAGPNGVRVACGNQDVGTGNEVRFESEPGGNAQLIFYDANVDESLVTLEASTAGLTVTVHGITNTTTSFFSSFSGVHVCAPEDSSLFHPANFGLIVEATGLHKNVGDVPIYPTEAVPVVRLATEGSKAVFGVIAYMEPANFPLRPMIAGSLTIVGNREVNDRRLVIVSIGEGAMWVLSERGALQNGDFIEASSVTGYGRKAESDVMTNKIVAKITGPCNFDGTLDRVPIYTDLIVEGNTVLDSAGVPVQVQATDGEGNPLTRPRYMTKQVGPWLAAYVGVTFHCG